MPQSRKKSVLLASKPLKDLLGVQTAQYCVNCKCLPTGMTASQIGFLSANRKMRLARLYSRLLLFPKILLQSKIIFGIVLKHTVGECFSCQTKSCFKRLFINSEIIKDATSRCRRGGACSSYQTKNILGGIQLRPSESSFTNPCKKTKTSFSLQNKK